jgi:hypothetical protein
MEFINDINCALLKRDVFSVEFLLNYVRFNFQDAVLSYYVYPIYHAESIYSVEDSAYHRALCTLVNHTVEKVELIKDDLIISFSGERKLICSLAVADREIPEAMEVSSNDVWVIL